MEYKVISVKQAKANKVCVVENENGVKFEDVFISPKFDDGRTTFEGIIEGSLLIGDITTSDYNGKTYRWLNAPTRGSLNGPRRGKQQAVAAAMERKENMIAQAQENRDIGIKIASSARDATLLVVALKPANEEEARKMWLRWRKWLFDNWSNTDGYPTETSPEDYPF